MTPEGKVKAAVDDKLRRLKAYYHKPVMNGMGAPALDYHVGQHGYYAGIETKEKGKHPTPRQTKTMRDLIAAGNSVFLIDQISGGDMEELVKWLTFPRPGFISTSAIDWLKRNAIESRDDRHRDPVQAT